jgi:hypothetical protein
MESPKFEQSFNLQDYLPGDLINDMSLLDDSGSLYPEEQYTPATNIGVQSIHYGCRYFPQNPTMPTRLYLQKQLLLENPYLNMKFFYGIGQPTAIVVQSVPKKPVSSPKRDEEVKQPRKKKVDVKLCEFLKSQKGSRIYQRKLKKISKEELDELLASLKDLFGELLINVYGNYFCQKLYTVSSLEQRKFILENVRTFY